MKNFKNYRSQLINYTMINHTFDIYNGKKMVQIKISREMLGKKLGEFALTRKMKKNIHKKK
ncbi:MAG: hypothetical protein CMF42_01550 [Legionellales bacterium]|nr:hypothetical protein [Legionellales bacterium]